MTRSWHEKVPWFASTGGKRGTFKYSQRGVSGFQLGKVRPSHLRLENIAMGASRASLVSALRSKERLIGL